MPKLVKLKQSAVDIKQTLEEFLLVRQANGLSKRTLEDYRWHIEKFLEFSSSPSNYEAVQKAVLRFFSQPCSPGYRNIKLKYLRAFFNWCVQEGYLPANPTAKIRKAREDIDNARHVTLEGLRKLIHQPDKKTYTGLRDYCLILVQIDTGVRPGELLQVRVSDLYLESREIWIRPEVAKTRIGKTLAISPHTAQALVKFLKLRPS